uniref:Transposon TX1 n=1 Tax=Tanacetum cinerariifolium TaxID=118510 RepID=A0A6L2KCE9_TANCI|nr:transposon TX1 [Tanacetum cinerariifolium]
MDGIEALGMSVTLKRSLMDKRETGTKKRVAGRAGTMDVGTREKKIENKEQKEDVRTVKVCDDEVNTRLFNKCLIGEVKSMCFFTNVGSICEEQGLRNIEVKLLRGLEVLMVFDTLKTATNILNSSEHGLRRWVYKLRRWNKHYILLEEVGDVMEFKMKEKGVIGKNKIEHMETHKNEDENDMVVSESSDDGTDSEDERDETDDGQFGNGPGNGPIIETGLFNEEKEINYCGPNEEAYSGDDRINKKRKTNGDVKDDVISNMNENTSNIKDVEFDEANKTNVFNEDLDNEIRNNGKKGGKKVLKSSKRAEDEGLDTDEKGLADSDSKGCSINMKHVKEIGKIIGVSWAKAKNKKIISFNIRGLGEAGKKGWIMTIIKEDLPDIIGLQETKCGVIDDIVIEDLWGGSDFGFSQLAAHGKWKGKDEDVSLACVYGPHVGRQKACLWERIRGISTDDALLVEKEFTEKEILEAVRESGENQKGGRKVEGLNVIIKEAVDKGVFRGVTIGRNIIVASHLQYADDIIFLGEWNKENVKALVCILKCFEEVFALRVNYNKSKLYGVGVNGGDMRDMARWMICGVGEFLFTYLGLPTGENIRRVDIWVGMVKLCHRFSRIYHLDRSKEGRVVERQKWVDNVWCWEWGWVRNLRGSVCNDFEDLQALSQDVVIEFDCKDHWR